MPQTFPNWWLLSETKNIFSKVSNIMKIWAWSANLKNVNPLNPTLPANSSETYASSLLYSSLSLKVVVNQAEVSLGIDMFPVLCKRKGFRLDTEALAKMETHKLFEDLIGEKLL